jgi:rare lipoprotein A
MKNLKLVLIFCCYFIGICSAFAQKTWQNDSTMFKVLSRKTGTASFYAVRFHGNRTNSGERLNNEDYTCAHPNLPFGTYVRVTNKVNGLSVVVRVNDRFRQRGNHLVDLTRRAAEDIDMIRYGRVGIILEVLEATVGVKLVEREKDEVHDMLQPSVVEPFPVYEKDQVFLREITPI